MGNDAPAWVLCVNVTGTAGRPDGIPVKIQAYSGVEIVVQGPVGEKHQSAGTGAEKAGSRQKRPNRYDIEPDFYIYHRREEGRGKGTNRDREKPGAIKENIAMGAGERKEEWRRG